MHPFDVFLSYRSHDQDWVSSLQKALESRGVRVWRDKDQIRPGDRFVRALQNGLETSRAVALVVTPESLRSGWVEDEYSKAVDLSNAGQLQLIPLLLEDATLPGFLSNRQSVDFRDKQLFEQSVDRLVWPGITGKQVIWYVVFGRHNSDRWKRLFTIARREGVVFNEGADIHRSNWFLQPVIHDPTKRLVLVFDIFEERPAAPHICRNHIPEYLDTIRSYREETRGKPNEIVFLLYHQKDAWKRVAEAKLVDKTERDRLQHYLTLFQDIPTDDQFAMRFREVWIRIQRDLMVMETRNDVA
jgi:hypothetical protein